MVGFTTSAGLVAVSGGGVGELESQPITSAAVSRGRTTDRCAMKVTTASHLVLDFQQNLCKEGNLLCAAVSNDAHFFITRDPEIKFGISFAIGKRISEITRSPGGHDQSGSSPKRDGDQY